MAYSQNPYSVGLTAGTRVADGKILTFLASDLTGPTSPPAVGDPVYNAGTPGVALETASASTDYIAVETEGIWNLNVVASDDAGTSAVAIGDELFISTAGVISKKTSGKFFGVARAAATGSASATVIPVSVGKQVRGSKPLKGQRFSVSYNFAAADVAKTVFTAPAACALISAIERHGVVAGQAGTLTLEKCNTGEAAASGDPMLAATWDLTSTINTPVSKAANADGTQLMVAGDAVFLKLASGAATSLANANVTLLLEWM